MKRLFLSIFLIGVLSWGQDGSLDLSFGNNGVVQTDIFEESNDDLNAICETLNGRVIVVGDYLTDLFEGYDIILAYTPDGQIDTSFGDNGIIQEPSTYNISFFYVETFSDGAILTGKYETGVRKYYKYDANGTLDETFAGTGTFIPDFPNHKAVTILSNDAILCYGVKIIDEIPYVVLQQYLSNGNLDITFADNGEASFAVTNGTNASIQGLLNIGAEGEFILGLRAEANETVEHSIVRFHPDGSMDESFGNGGQKVFPLEPEYGFSPQIIPGSNVLYLNCIYYDPIDEEYHRKMLKLDALGNLDQGFGVNGTKEDISARLVQPNGRFFYVTFWSDWEGVSHIDQFNRYFGDGYLDDSFNLDLAYNDFNLGARMFLRNNGTILIGGATAWYSGDPDIILQQLNNSPLGIEDFQVNNILVSPNPSTGIFHIEFENFEQNLEYTIYDITGKLVKTGRFDSPNTSLDLSHYEDGMYFLNLQGITLKLLKQ